MRKSILYLFVILSFSSCVSISYDAMTDNVLGLYQRAVKNPYTVNRSIDSLYACKSLYGKKKYFKKRKIAPAGYAIRKFASKQLAGQPQKFKLVNAGTKRKFNQLFSNNGKGEELNLFTRKIFMPQSAYSHLSSPYKNEAYVFYVFTKYDSVTGMGKYYQSDSYYPRDAFSFSPKDFCPNTDTSSCYNKIEFFTGVYYLTHSELLSVDVICLLGTSNDLNERKIFSIDTVAGKFVFTKAFDNYIYNFYPVIDNSYSIIQGNPVQKDAKTISSMFYDEIQRLSALKGAEAEKTRFNMNITNVAIPLKDYFYPLKEGKQDTVTKGWVYLGEKNNCLVYSETFYHNKDGKYVNRSKEITKLKELNKLKSASKSFISPFDILKVHNDIPNDSDNFKNMFNNAKIIGEVYPNLNYKLYDYKIVDNSIWAYIILQP